MAPLRGRSDALMIAQDALDRARGAWQAHLSQAGAGFPLKKVADGFGSRNAVEIMRRMVADLEDAIDHERAEERGDAGVRASG